MSAIERFFGKRRCGEVFSCPLLSLRPASASADLTISITPLAIDTLSKHGAFGADAIGIIAHKTVATCEELGLISRRQVHCVIDVRDESNPNHDTRMSITKITPPVVHPVTERDIDRAIIVWLPSFAGEFAEFRTLLGRTRPPSSPSSVAGMFAANTATMLAHEIVHLLVTDEFSGPYNALGLARLELLTDAVAFRALHDDYCAPGIARDGFMNGLGYLANDVMKNLGESALTRDALFRGMNDRATKIIANDAQSLPRA